MQIRQGPLADRLREQLLTESSSFWLNSQKPTSALTLTNRTRQILSPSKCCLTTLWSPWANLRYLHIHLQTNPKWYDNSSIKWPPSMTLPLCCFLSPPFFGFSSVIVVWLYFDILSVSIIIYLKRKCTCAWSICQLHQVGRSSDFDS